MSSRRSSFSSLLPIDAFAFCYPCACENERRGKERDENQSENNEKKEKRVILMKRKVQNSHAMTLGLLQRGLEVTTHQDNR